MKNDFEFFFFIGSLMKMTNDCIFQSLTFSLSGVNVAEGKTNLLLENSCVGIHILMLNFLIRSVWCEAHVLGQLYYIMGMQFHQITTSILILAGQFDEYFKWVTTVVICHLKQTLLLKHFWLCGSVLKLLVVYVYAVQQQKISIDISKEF